LNTHPEHFCHGTEGGRGGDNDDCKHPHDQNDGASWDWRIHYMHGKCMMERVWKGTDGVQYRAGAPNKVTENG